MDELKEVKFLRTGKEYNLEKTESGFNLRLIDLDDSLAPISKTFQQMLDLSQAGQVVFSGFEEKKDQAELILISCMHQEKIAILKKEADALRADNEKLANDIAALQAENKTALEQNQSLQAANDLLTEAKELADKN